MNVYQLETFRFDPRYRRFQQANPKTFPDFYPALYEDAPWQPPRLARNWKPHKLIGDVWPENDFPGAGAPVNLTPVFSPRAVDGLRDLLEPSGELLPVTTPLGTYYAYNVTNVIEALDAPHSFGNWNTEGTRAREISEFEFRPRLLKNQSIFKIPQMPVEIYVTQPFVDRVRKLKLNGFWMTLCWPMPKGVQWLDAWKSELEKMKAAAAKASSTQQADIDKALAHPVSRAPRNLDLRKDIPAIRKLLWRAIKFIEKRQAQWKKHGTFVSAIGLETSGWDLDVGPLVQCHVDIRDVHAIDGHWSDYGVATISIPRWTAFMRAVDESEAPRTVTDIRGKVHTMSKDETRLFEWFGKAMVEAIRETRADGTLHVLLQPRRCGFYVEDTDSGYFWSSRRRRT